MHLSKVDCFFSFRQKQSSQKGCSVWDRHSCLSPLVDNGRHVFYLVGVYMPIQSLTGNRKQFPGNKRTMTSPALSRLARRARVTLAGVLRKLVSRSLDSWSLSVLCASYLHLLSGTSPLAPLHFTPSFGLPLYISVLYHRPISTYLPSERIRFRRAISLDQHCVNSNNDAILFMSHFNMAPMQNGDLEVGPYFTVHWCVPLVFHDPWEQVQHIKRATFDNGITRA